MRTVRAVAMFALIALVTSIAVTGSISPAYAVLSGSKTVKLYLQKDASVGTVNNVATNGLIMKTTTASSGEDKVGSNGNLDIHYYLYPVLAGNLVLNGDISVIIYARTGTSSESGVTFVSELNKIDSGGSSTNIANQSATIDLTTSNQVFTNTLSSVSETVALGYILDLNIRLYKASVSQDFILAVGYSATPTRMEVVADNHIELVSLVKSKEVVTTDSIKFTLTAKDVFGTYDLTPKITVTSPRGTEVNAVSMTQATGAAGDLQGTWTYTLTPYNTNGQTWQGTWQTTGDAQDQTGNSVTSGTLTFQYNIVGQGQVQQQVEQEPSTALTSRDPVVVILLVLVIIALVLGIYRTTKGGGRRRR